MSRERILLPGFSPRVRARIHAGLPARALRDGRTVVSPLFDTHVAMLLDEAVYHAEHLRLGVRDTAGVDQRAS